MRVGIYASMRNETKNLDVWIESVDEADAVVINDTGSIDGTYDQLLDRTVAGGHFAVCREPVEPMELSNALNIAIALLPHDLDLVIRLDADERLQPGWRQAIEAAYAQRTTDLPLLMPVWFDHRAPYLHTRAHSRHGFRWTEPVHEVLVTDDGRPAYVNGDIDYLERIVADTLIEHHQDPTKDRSQVLGELQAAHEADPTNPRLQHYLAREQTYRGNWQAAIPLLRTHASGDSFPEERSESWLLLGDAYSALMDIEDVPTRPYANAVRTCPQRREGWVALADLHMKQGRWHDCLYAAEHALAITERSWYFNQPFAWGGMPWHLAALASWYLDRHDDARRYGTRAVEFEPANDLYRTNLGFYVGALISAESAHRARHMSLGRRFRDARANPAPTTTIKEPHMGTAANVLVGATGQVNFGPTGTTLPTSAADGLDGALVDLGYCSDAGVEEDHAQTNKPVKRWGGQTVRNLLTEQTDTYKMTFLETNPDVLEAYHGPQDDPSTVVNVTISQGQRGVWVIDALDGDNIIRHVISDGQVSALDPIKYAADEAVTYGVTITAYPDTDGVTVKKYVIDTSVS